jgi:hypothetical protein
LLAKPAQPVTQVLPDRVHENKTKKTMFCSRFD